MSKYKYIMWDWNGTLLDDLTVNYEAINKLLSDRGLDLMQSVSEYKDAFGFPIISFYEKVGFDLENEKFEDIAKDYIREYYSRFPECELFPEAEKILRQIIAMGLEQLIVSATEQESLLRQVESFGVDHLFTDILGTGDIYAKSKVDIGKNWAKQNAVRGDEVLFVGDTTHDYEVAQNIGCDCILVATGHNSKEKLILTGCTVAENLEDVKKYIEEK